jgi:hypothetical protein
MIFPSKPFFHADFYILGEYEYLEAVERFFKVLGDVEFEEHTGYHEYPAYSAFTNGIKYSILGIPELEEQITDEPIENYQVIVRHYGFEDFDQKCTEFDLSEPLIELINQSGLLKAMSWLDK